MECTVCNKKLRSDNTIGTCRKHRAQSPLRYAYEKRWKNDNEKQYKNICKQWRTENRPKLNEWQKKYLTTNIQAKLRHNIRSRLNKVVGNPGNSINNLGCSVSEFIIYLEEMFQAGMNWNNYGEWHLDHIKPLSKFDLTDERQFKEAVHYSNLQPLWAIENIKKGNR